MVRLREYLQQKRKAANTEGATPEEVERYIQAYQCPYCRDGKTYRMLSLHICQIHGLTAYKFRELYGFNRSHRLCSYETSELMIENIQRRGGPNKAWLEYDRRKSIEHRFEDGGQRPESIKRKKALAKMPENIESFLEKMAKVDRKMLAAQMPPDVRKAIAAKGGKALVRLVGQKNMVERMAYGRSQRTVESEQKRIKHANVTMQKYREDPYWHENWLSKTTEVIQTKAKIPRSEYERIASLSDCKQSQAQIARIYGVSRALISLILRAYKEGLSTLPRNK